MICLIQTHHFWLPVIHWWITPRGNRVELAQMNNMSGGAGSRPRWQRHSPEG